MSVLCKEDPERQNEQWPDLLLIDGGAGQVNAIGKVMREFGIEGIAMIGVAKGVDRDHGKEEFHMLGKRPFALQRNDPYSSLNLRAALSCYLTVPVM